MSYGARLTVVVAHGAWGTVEYAVLLSGHVPAKEFLDDAKPASIRARFEVLFQQMANYGNVSSKRFKKEMGKLYAFRHEIGNKQIRCPCFQDENRWIVTHGFFKPGAQKNRGQWPSSEVDRAERIRSEYF